MEVGGETKDQDCTVMGRLVLTILIAVIPSEELRGDAGERIRRMKIFCHRDVYTSR